MDLFKEYNYYVGYSNQVMGNSPCIIYKMQIYPDDEVFSDRMEFYFLIRKLAIK